MPTDEEIKVSLKGGYNTLTGLKEANAPNISTVNEEVYKLNEFWSNTKLQSTNWHSVVLQQIPILLQSIQENLGVPQEPVLKTRGTIQIEVTHTALTSTMKELNRN